MTQVRDVAPITWQERREDYMLDSNNHSTNKTITWQELREDYMLDSNNHSTNKTPTTEDATTEINHNIQPHSSGLFRISIKTSKEGVVTFHGSLIPYLENGLNVTHTKQ